MTPRSASAARAPRRCGPCARCDQPCQGQAGGWKRGGGGVTLGAGRSSGGAVRPATGPFSYLLLPSWGWGLSPTPRRRGLAGQPQPPCKLDRVDAAPAGLRWPGARPSQPAHLCTKAAGSWGASYWTTQPTSGMSRPRAARSVVSRTPLGRGGAGRGGAGQGGAGRGPARGVRGRRGGGPRFPPPTRHRSAAC
jgi:hypothetical protein